MLHAPNPGLFCRKYSFQVGRRQVVQIEQIKAAFPDKVGYPFRIRQDAREEVHAEDEPAFQLRGRGEDGPARLLGYPNCQALFPLGQEHRLDAYFTQFLRDARVLAFFQVVTKKGRKGKAAPVSALEELKEAVCASAPLFSSIGD